MRDRCSLLWALSAGSGDLLCFFGVIYGFWVLIVGVQIAAYCMQHGARSCDRGAAAAGHAAEGRQRLRNYGAFAIIIAIPFSRCVALSV